MKFSIATTALALSFSATATLVQARQCPSYDDQAVIFVIAKSPDAEGLEEAVEKFEDLFGGIGDNGNAIGPQDDGYRTINWDGVGAPFVMPPDFFHINVNRGLEMVPVNPHQTFLLSNDQDDLDDKFDSINQDAAADFITFSPERLFASQGASTLKMIFHEAGSGAGAEQALTNGFGTVFVDVELPGQTKVVAKDTNGCVITEAYALPQNGGLSYVGIFVADYIIDSIEIEIPNAIDDGQGDRRLGKKGKSGGKGKAGRKGKAGKGGRIQDFVVMDDFSYGEPTNAGEPDTGD